MLTSINLRVTVAHASSSSDEAIRERVLGEFQQMARRGALLAVVDGHEIYTAAVERTFTDAQRAALLEALDTETHALRDSLLRPGEWSDDETAELQAELLVLQDCRDRIEE